MRLYIGDLLACLPSSSEESTIGSSSFPRVSVTFGRIGPTSLAVLVDSIITVRKTTGYETVDIHLLCGDRTGILSSLLESELKTTTFFGVVLGRSARLTQSVLQQHEVSRHTTHLAATASPAS